MLKLAVIGMSLLTCGLWFIRDELATLMTNDTQVRLETVRYLVFNFLSAPLMVANLVLVGVFLGAGATQYPMWSYLFSVWGGQWWPHSSCSLPSFSGCYSARTGNALR